MKKTKLPQSRYYKKMTSRGKLPLLRGMFIASERGRIRKWAAYLESLAVGLPATADIGINPTRG